MNEYPFHPELFEAWGRALAALSKAGWMWLSHFRSIDLEHEVFGLSVCGIDDDEVAIQMARTLMATFPSWPWGTLYFDDVNVDKGWVVRISRDVEPTGPGGEARDATSRPDTLRAAIARRRLGQRRRRDKSPDEEAEAGAEQPPRPSEAHDRTLRTLRETLRALADGPREQPASAEQRLRLVVLHAVLATTYRRAGNRAAALRHLKRAALRSNPEPRPATESLPPDIVVEGLPPATQQEVAWWWWLAEGGGFDVEACRVLGALLTTWARQDEREATPRACLAYLAVKTRLWPLAG